MISKSFFTNNLFVVYFYNFFFCKSFLHFSTNLTDNLDPAFERRFLFKIQFENPSVEAKKAIWKNKLPWLTTEKAQHLAKTYNFSGGEIDCCLNIGKFQIFITIFNQINPLETRKVSGVCTISDAFL